MKRIFAVLCVLLLSPFLVMEALATDEDDLKTAAMKVLTAVNSLDGAIYSQYFHEGSDYFNDDGGLITIFNPTGAKAYFAKAKEEGVIKWNVQWRHLSVKVYGSSAVVTGYFVGNRTETDGTTHSINVRSSGLWVKRDGKWKIAHYHNSELLPATSQ